MDLVHDRANIILEEDRISNLPDDIIHRILSFLDMKYAIQTSTLSKKWKNIWTSMPHLNFASYEFDTLPRFAKFVKHVLSHRNHHSEVSTVELKCTGATTQFVVKSIVDYAYSHNVQHLTVKWYNMKWVPRKWYTRKDIEFPQYLFSSHTLKHLTIATDCHFGCWVPKSLTWDFPALETLELSNMQLCDITDTGLNLFSKCVNLKDLTLKGISMDGLDIFNVCAPQLSNLTIIDSFHFPKVFDVCAPQLSNLTITNSIPTSKVFKVFAPQLESMTLPVSSRGSCSSLQLPTEGFKSLEKVNLSLNLDHRWDREKVRKERLVQELLDLFQKLCRAKFLILNNGIIEALSSCYQLALEPCPFNNLKCLKIDKRNDLIATMPPHVRDYFLESSPSATLIMDLPQVAWKRSSEEVDKETMANKVAKLEEEKHIQDEVIAQQKAMLEAMKLQHEKLMSQIMNWKMTELQVQVAGGNPDFELIRSMGRDIKSIMELTPESLREVVEAHFSCQYEEVKRLFLTNIDASQWAKIEMELGTTTQTLPNQG